MTADIATLGIAVETRGVTEGAAALDGLSAAGDKAEKSAERLTSKTKELSSVTENLVGAAKAAAAAFGLYKLAEYAKDAALLNARYETLGISMEVIGRNVGYTAQQMEAAAVGMQKMGISMVESRQQAMRLVQANIDLAESTKLARIAQDAAVIGGINSSEAFSRMIHGITTGQSEVLRGIGINVSMEQSYKQMAATLHKNADALTQNEKTQAILNAVMLQGKDIAGVYEAAMGTAGKQLLSMTRYTEDLKTKQGEVFNEVLTVAVMAYTEHLKKANGEMDEMSKNGELDAWGRNIAEMFVSMANAADNFATSIKMGGTWLAHLNAQSEIRDRYKAQLDTIKDDGGFGANSAISKRAAILEEQKKALEAEQKQYEESQVNIAKSADRWQRQWEDRQKANAEKKAQIRASQIAKEQDYADALLEVQARYANASEKLRNKAVADLYQSFFGDNHKYKDDPVQPKTQALSEYERLTKAIKEKIEVQTLELSLDEKATEGEKMRAKVNADLANGYLKLKASEKSRIDSLLAELVATEKLAESKKNLEHWKKTLLEEDANVRAVWMDDHYKTLEGIEKEIDAQKAHNEVVGLSKEALASLADQKIADLILDKERERAVIASIKGQEEKVDAIDAEIDAYKRLREAKQIGVGKDAAAEEAKRITEEAKKSAENIERSLTDALMRGFESGKGFAKNFRDSLVNMFKTLVLQPIVRFGVQGALGAMGFGASTMAGASDMTGGGGNIMNLANQGMSLWNMGSAIAGGYGALPGTAAAANLSGMVGGDTLGNFIAMNPHWTAGAGAMGALGAGALTGASGSVVSSAMAAGATGVEAAMAGGALGGAAAGGAAGAGAAGLMSTIGAAIPWIGIAIAVASMLSKDRGGPKYEGAQGFNLNTGASFSDELLPDAIRGYTKDDADAQINELMKPVIAGMGTTAKAFGGKLGDDMQARFSLVRDPLGKASSFAGADLFVGDKQVYHSNHDYGRDDKDFQAGVELEAKRLTLASLAFSEGIDPIVQALLRGTNIAEASLADVDALMARATAVNSLSGTIDSLRNGTTELDRTFSDLLVSGVDKAVADANPFIADALAKITPDAAALNQISLGFDDAGNEIFVTLGESLQAEADAFVAPDVDVAAIQTSLKTGLSKVYQDLLDGYDPMTASAEDTTKRTKTLQGTKILSDTFDRLGFSIAGITADSIHATANLDTFAANTQAYYAAITTPQKQVDDALDALGQQFGKVGLTMPTTVQGFEALVAGVDKTTPAGMRMVEMLMQLFPAFQQTANAAEALRKQQTAAVRSMRDALDRLNGVSDLDRAQKTFDNAQSDVFLEAAKEPLTAWIDTWGEVLALTDAQINALRDANPALYDMIAGALQAADSLNSVTGSASAAQDRFKPQSSVQQAAAAQVNLEAEIAKAFGASGLMDIANALAGGDDALARLSEPMQNAAQELADSNEAMHLAALGLQKITNDAHQDKSGKWTWDFGEMESMLAEMYSQIFGAAGEALTAGGGDFGANTSRMMAIVQAERDRKQQQYLEETRNGYIGTPASEIAMRELDKLLASLSGDLTKYQGYESQYKGHGKELLDLDAWKKAQMALAMGNQDAIDAINESYATQFEKIIAGATEGADTATKAWLDFRESLRSSLEDVGLSDMAKRIKDIGKQYEDNVKKAKELADAAGVGRTQVDTAQGKLTGLLDKGDILAAQKLAKQQQIAALESALPEGSLGSEELRRARADLVALTSAQAANSEEVRKARERLQALLGSQVDLDDALKDAEALRLALLNKLHSDWAAGLSSKLEDIGLSDTGRALKALREEFEKNRQSAIDLGGSTADLTLATALYKAQLDKMLSDFMAPISEQLAMLGLSDHEKAIYDINKAYEENMRKARELGATVGQLAEIEALRNAQLQQLAKQEAESNLRAAYDAQAAALQKIIDAADGAKDKLQGAFDTAFNEVDGLRQKFIDFADSLKAFNASLTLNAPSTTNDQKGALLQADFADLVSRAIKGDEKAYGGLQGSAQALLDYRRDNASTALDYARSLAAAKEGLQQAEDAARNQATDLETQIELARKQVGALIDLKDITKKSWRESLDIAVAEYNTTMKAAEDAKTQLVLLQTQVGALIDIKDAINVGNKSMTDLAAAVQSAVAAMLAANKKPDVVTPIKINDGNMLTGMNRATIDGFYQSILGRSPDAAGMQYWMNELNSGSLTLDGVKASIVASNEAKTRNEVSPQPIAIPLPDAALIERLTAPQQSNAELVAEVRLLREATVAGQSQIAYNTGATAKATRQMNEDGVTSR